MICPKCLDSSTKVTDSRPSDDDRTIRRRRECPKCNYRFTTYERIEETPIIVVKKNDVRQEFNGDKLVNGMLKACEKRPISLEQVEKAVAKIEFDIRNDMKKEIDSKEIGEMVMTALKKLDEVAYIRFASVYRQFKDVSSFVDEINKL